MLFFFFFSSRRRHTRCSRDWSSDVCSSDLSQPLVHGRHVGELQSPAELDAEESEAHVQQLPETEDGFLHREKLDTACHFVKDAPRCILETWRAVGCRRIRPPISGGLQ